uniref:Uncharacterized protein n=1 Tax=Anguilla anguilla TaxID=7936 RepID=A0A0E9QMT3_ANGAN
MFNLTQAHTDAFDKFPDICLWFKWKPRWRHTMKAWRDASL